MEFDKRFQDPKTVKELVVISRTEDGRPTKLYERFKIPLMSERECILDIDFKALSGEHEGKYLWIVKSVQDPAYPPKKGVITMFMYKAAMVWEEGDGIHSLEYSSANMGGYFPMRLLSMAIGSMMKAQMAQFMTILNEIQAERESTGATDWCNYY